MNDVSERIHHWILSRVVEGDLAPGDQIPTEKELAKRFSTNRMNAHHAVKALEGEGVVERRKRRGTRIRPDLPPESLPAIRDEMVDHVRVFIHPAVPGGFRHWNDTALNEFERVLNADGLKVRYAAPPTLAEELEAVTEELSVVGARGLVFFARERDLNLLLKRKDLLAGYRDRVFIVNPGVYPTDRVPFHSLSFDTFGEGMLVGAHLKERRIPQASFVKTGDSFWLNQRLDGVRCALAGSSVEFSVIEAGREALIPLIEERVGASRAKPAFITPTDKMATGLIDELSERGINVIADFHVVSFNNDPQFRHYNLTSVAPPVERIGSAAARLILEKRWSGEDDTQINVKLSSRLVVRDSC